MDMIRVIFELAVLAAAGGLLLFARFYLPSYMSEKGKNLATKEDIRKITDEVEGVKFDYAQRLEELGQQNRLLIEQTRPATAEEVARRERLVLAKLEAYSTSIDLLSQIMSSMHWSGPTVPPGRPLGAPPDEWRVNAAVARLGLFADDAKLLDAFYKTAMGGDNAIKDWERFVSLARRDMKYGQVELEENDFKYVFGRPPLA